jgi:hypothetical protein
MYDYLGRRNTSWTRRNARNLGIWLRYERALGCTMGTHLGAASAIFTLFSTLIPQFHFCFTCAWQCHHHQSSTAYLQSSQASSCSWRSFPSPSLPYTHSVQHRSRRTVQKVRHRVRELIMPWVYSTARHPVFRGAWSATLKGEARPT